MVTDRQRKLVEKQVDKARAQARLQMDACEELKVLRRFAVFFTLLALIVVLIRIYSV